MFNVYGYKSWERPKKHRYTATKTWQHVDNLLMFKVDFKQGGG